MWWRLLPKRMWGVGLVLIAGLGVVFYAVLARGTKLGMTQQLLKRQQTVARAEASNLTAFFQTLGKSVAVFAQLNSMKRGGVAALEDMKVFVEQWRDSNLIGGMVLTNKEGIVQLNANVLGTSDVGASLADRDYFVWAKDRAKPRDYFVGEPIISRIGTTKGQLIVPVVAAVYQEGKFVGVLSASVKLGALTERHLEGVKVSELAETYLTNGQGGVIYSSAAPVEMGASVFELVPELKDRLDGATEGNLAASGRLVAYAPVSLDSQNWWLVMAMPNEDLMEATVPIYVRQIIILVLESVTILLFGMMVAREKQVQKTL